MYYTLDYIQITIYYILFHDPIYLNKVSEFWVLSSDTNNILQLAGYTVSCHVSAHTKLKLLIWS